MEQKDNFVPQDIAKALKDLGFDTPCLAWWFEEGTVSVPTETRRMWDNWNQYVTQKRMSAPLWQQVFEWFRVKYRIFAVIDTYTEDRFGYTIKEYTDHKVTPTQLETNYFYMSYESAQQECLKKIIEILKSR